MYLGYGCPQGKAALHAGPELPAGGWFTALDGPGEQRDPELRSGL